MWGDEGEPKEGIDATNVKQENRWCRTVFNTKGKIYLCALSNEAD